MKEEIISWIKTIIITLLAVFLINTFIFRTVQVQGSSMQPTLAQHDRMIVWRLFYSPAFLDVIVLQHTDGDFHVKRILGTPGDRVDYVNGEMIVNGMIINEPYIMLEESRNGFIFEDLCQFDDCNVIPDDYFLVLGDNRNNSGDSRYYGLINSSQIIGRAALRFLPFDSFGTIE